MGVGDRKGQIRKGYDADIVVCSKELYAQQTYVMGNKVY